MHTSFFNYPVTRPYPYKWFTPVGLIGLAVFLVLFSILNFVQNSYTLIFEYADNPNSTITNGIWFKNWPSYLTSSVRPICQPTNLPVNTQFFTNQSGLTWTITSVFTNDSSAKALPSLPYLNNVFENCSVPEIRVDFDGSSDRLTGVGSIPAWDIQVRSFVTCGVWGPIGYNLLNMTAMYDPWPPIRVAGSTQFVATSMGERASMYWAETLLYGNLIATEGKVAEKTLDLNPTFTKGAAVLYPNKHQADITKLDFFNLSFFFPYFNSTNQLDGYEGQLASAGLYIADKLFYKSLQLSVTPQIWKEVDALAKSMYSASLADLGQTSANPQSNIVSKATTLQHFLGYYGEDFYPVHVLNFSPRQRNQVPTAKLQETTGSLGE